MNTTTQSSVKEEQIVLAVSQRDYFAAKALQGCFTSPIEATSEGKQYISVHCYRMADAMLKARIQP